MRRTAFSLVELLVVITIIVVLLAMISPALESAIYQAELVDCAGRMKVWGSMGITFAQDHQRKLPMAFGPCSTSLEAQGYDEMLARVPDRIGDEPAHETNGRWTTCGTPWDTWVGYGLNNKLAVCPIWQGLGFLSGSYLSSNPANPHPQHLTGAVDEFAGWGKQVWIGYQWLAGTDLTHERQGDNEFEWGSRPPASRLTNAASNSVLASDLLYMNNGWGSPPLNFRAVAHPVPENYAQPRSMNIVFGDTHVQVERESFFEQPLIFGNTGSPSKPQYSYKGGASYYWWGK